jgi:Fic family protein
LGYPPLSSLSSVIEVDKKAYDAILEQTQRGGLRIDDWLTWFVAPVLAAQDMARERVAFVVEKARFFDRFRETSTRASTRPSSGCSPPGRRASRAA